MWGNLLPKKAVELRGLDEEEEGSSSTLGKEDTEDGKIANEDQTVAIPTEQVEIHLAESQGQDPIMIKEGILEGDGRGQEEEKVTLKVEDEIQILPPLVPSH